MDTLTRKKARTYHQRRLPRPMTIGCLCRSLSPVDSVIKTTSWITTGKNWREGFALRVQLLPNVHRRSVGYQLAHGHSSTCNSCLYKGPQPPLLGPVCFTIIKHLGKASTTTTLSFKSLTGRGCYLAHHGSET
jgi:hypothetical protein